MSETKEIGLPVHEKYAPPAAIQAAAIINSRAAYDAFVAAGATQVQLLDPLPIADHGACAPVALFASKIWFDSLKR